jgi:hypothetical protein
MDLRVCESDLYSDSNPLYWAALGLVRDVGEDETGVKVDVAIVSRKGPRSTANESDNAEVTE